MPPVWQCAGGSCCYLDMWIAGIGVARRTSCLVWLEDALSLRAGVQCFARVTRVAVELSSRTKFAWCSHTVCYWFGGVPRLLLSLGFKRTARTSTACLVTQGPNSIIHTCTAAALSLACARVCPGCSEDALAYYVFDTVLSTAFCGVWGIRFKPCCGVWTRCLSAGRLCVLCTHHHQQPVKHVSSTCTSLVSLVSARRQPDYDM